MHGILVPLNCCTITLLLEHHRLVGRHKIWTAEAFGHRQHLRGTKQFQRCRLSFVVHVINTKHNPPGGTLRKTIIVEVRIILARVQPRFNPVLCSLLEMLEEVLRYPVAQDEITVLIEEPYLLLCQVVWRTRNSTGSLNRLSARIAIHGFSFLS